jgi:hypothetical protein
MFSNDLVIRLGWVDGLPIRGQIASASGAFCGWANPSYSDLRKCATSKLARRATVASETSEHHATLSFFNKNLIEGIAIRAVRYFNIGNYGDLPKGLIQRDRLEQLLQEKAIDLATVPERQHGVCVR